MHRTTAHLITLKFNCQVLAHSDDLFKSCWSQVVSSAIGYSVKQAIICGHLERGIDIFCDVIYMQ